MIFAWLYDYTHWKACMFFSIIVDLGFPDGVVVKKPPAVQVWSLGQEDPLKKGMATHSSILAGEFHRQRSLAGYSLWGRKESDTT